MTAIGIFTYSTRPRGSVVHACALADALTARGHDVTLYALSKQGDRLFRDVRCPVVLFRAEAAPADPDALIRQRIAEVVQGLRSARPRHDVYHAEDCLVASGLLEVRRELCLSRVVRTLHHLEHYASPYLRACQTRSVLEADQVVCVSRVSQRDVLHALGRSCPIVGNGVDLARFLERRPELGRELRQRIGGAEGDPIVLSVGGVEPRKNSLIALFGLADVLERQPRARWVIAGGASIWEHDHYRAQFRRELGALPPSVRERVIELGPVGEDELTELYGMARVLLCASLQEGFGLCVLEALAAGCPVVVSRGEPFTEYLDESCGSFVSPESPTQIAGAVLELLECEALRAARRQAGLLRASRHSWASVAQQHEALYAEPTTGIARALARQEQIHA